jgi:hypothetical protein
MNMPPQAEKSAIEKVIITWQALKSSERGML